VPEPGLIPLGDVPGPIRATSGDALGGTCGQRMMPTLDW
jgi:hypothetical protein